MNRFILIFATLLLSCSNEKKDNFSIFLEKPDKIEILISGNRVPATIFNLRNLRKLDPMRVVKIHLNIDSLITTQSLIECIDLGASAGFSHYEFIDTKSNNSFGYYNFEGKRDIDQKAYLLDTPGYTKIINNGIEYLNGAQILRVYVGDEEPFNKGEKITVSKITNLLINNKKDNIPTIVVCTGSSTCLVKDWIYLFKATNDAQTSTFSTKFILNRTVSAQ